MLIPESPTFSSPWWLRRFSLELAGGLSFNFPGKCLLKCKNPEEMVTPQFDLHCLRLSQLSRWFFFSCAMPFFWTCWPSESSEFSWIFCIGEPSADATFHSKPNRVLGKSCLPESKNVVKAPTSLYWPYINVIVPTPTFTPKSLQYIYIFICTYFLQSNSHTIIIQLADEFNPGTLAKSERENLQLGMPQNISWRHAGYTPVFGLPPHSMVSRMASSPILAGKFLTSGCLNKAWPRNQPVSQGNLWVPYQRSPLFGGWLTFFPASIVGTEHAPDTHHESF